MMRLKAIIDKFIGKPIYFINKGYYKPIISTGTLLSYGPNQVVIDFNGETIVRDYDQIAIKYERKILRRVEQHIDTERVTERPGEETVE